MANYRKNFRPRDATAIKASIIPGLLFTAAMAGAAEFSVTEDTDAALRSAVNSANQSLGPDTIVFAPEIGAITITQGQIEISDEVEILGSDELNPVVISTNLESRVFAVIDSPDNPTLSLRNLIIQGGRTTENGLVADPPSCASNSGQGGAICSETSLALENVVVENSRTTGDNADGGGVWAALDIEIVNSVIRNNETVGSPASGGGLRSATGTVICESSIIEFNSVDGQSSRGGGIRASVTQLIGCGVTGNSASGPGGGISSDRGTYARDSTISGNISGNAGGGILTSISPSGTGESVSGLKIVNSTISGNESATEGGGLFWLAGDTAIDVDGDGAVDTGISNSTFVDNSGTQDGGGIKIVDSASLTQPQARPLRSFGTAWEKAGSGGSVQADPAFTAIISSTIVNDNFALAGGEPNLSFEAGMRAEDSSVVVSASFVDEPISANIDALADNGCNIPAGTLLDSRCLLTHRPFTASPVLNAGENPLGLVFDQRGVPRQVDEATDIGAVERSPIITNFQLSDFTLSRGRTLTITWRAVPPETECTGEIRDVEEQFVAEWSGGVVGPEGSVDFSTADLQAAEYQVVLLCESTFLDEPRPVSSIALTGLLIEPAVVVLDLDAAEEVRFDTESFISFEAINSTTEFPVDAQAVSLTVDASEGLEILGGFRLAPSCSVSAPQEEPREVRCDVSQIPDWVCDVTDGILGCTLESLPPGGSAAVVVHVSSSSSGTLSGILTAANIDSEIDPVTSSFTVEN